MKAHGRVDSCRGWKTLSYRVSRVFCHLRCVTAALTAGRGLGLAARRRVNLSKVCFKVAAHIHGRTARNTRANGLTICAHPPSALPLKRVLSDEN
eukprot:6604493-Pyramimonas_sp.AAC.2